MKKKLMNECTSSPRERNELGRKIIVSIYERACRMVH